jgi:hypothetical protein
MKIIAYDNFKPGVTMEDVKPHLPEEVANVWRLWKAGIVRENYARADVNGVVIVFECSSVEEAKRYVEDFPLSKRGFLEWSYIPLDAPLPLEFLFDSESMLESPMTEQLFTADHERSLSFDPKRTLNPFRILTL